MTPPPSSSPETDAAWRYDPEQITTMLENAGFDIDLAPSQLRHGGGGISGRFIREHRTVLLAVDAGGRVRVTIQDQHGESTRSIAIPSGPTLTSVLREIREETLSGRVRSLRDLAAIVATLHDDQPRSRSDGPKPVPG